MHLGSRLDAISRHVGGPKPVIAGTCFIYEFDYHFHVLWERVWGMWLAESGQDVLQAVAACGILFAAESKPSVQDLAI